MDRRQQRLSMPLVFCNDKGDHVALNKINDMWPAERDTASKDLIYNALQILTTSERLHWVLLDKALQPIALSDQTHTLIARLFGEHQPDDLPEELNLQLSRTVEAKCKDLVDGKACSFKLYLQQGHLICYLYSLPQDDCPSAYMLKLIPNGPTEDFSPLTVMGLTKRETIVLSYLPLGYSNAQIAMALSISEGGVKKHLSNIAKKLNASGRAEILYKAILKKREINSKQLPGMPKS
jgi:DNA-binding CsgD family transcriptional regulator